MKSSINLLAHFGAQLNPPASESKLAGLEKRFGVVLPEDVRAIYMEADGAKQAFGEWQWMFWPIESDELSLDDYFKRPRKYEVEGRVVDPKKYFRFFDALIDAPIYAFCADRASLHFGEIIGISADDGKFDAFTAAASGAEFLARLIEYKCGQTILIQADMPNQSTDPAP